MTGKICEGCGISYLPTGRAQRFCSPTCNTVKKECIICNEPFLVVYNKRRARYCSRECRLTVWTKQKITQPTKIIDTNGYIVLYFGSESKISRMLEHRYIMEQALGRKLSDTETVHHIDGNRANNELSNLQLRQGKHGSGIQMQCLDCGSHNVTPVELA